MRLLMMFACLATVALAGCMYDKVEEEECNILAVGCDDVQFEPVYIRCDSVRITQKEICEIDWHALPFDSTILPSEEMDKIDLIMQYLTTNQYRNVSIEGYCNRYNEEVCNLIMGECLAQVVRDILTKKGIAEERILTFSRGSDIRIYPKNVLYASTPPNQHVYFVKFAIYELEALPRELLEL